MTSTSYQVLVYGATGGGVVAALAAARQGMKTVLVERGRHIGGMVSSGLALIDILRKNAVGGIFQEILAEIRRRYADTHGPDSEALRLTYGGLWPEPHVAQGVLDDMVRAQANLTVLTGHELIEAVLRGDEVIGSIYRDRCSSGQVRFEHAVAIDCTYEADLAAAAGVACRVGRESRQEYGEQFAGHIFYDWRYNQQRVLPQSTGEASPYVQAYCFRATVTDDERKRVPFERPECYSDFLPLYRHILKDISSGRSRRFHDVIYLVRLPNHKYDSNGNIEALSGLNLAEYNREWPDGTWETRDRLWRLYRDYTHGLWHFLQNDPGVSWIVREEARCFGLCADEYPEDGHFPWQLYVREGRRIVGEYTMTEHDSILEPGRGRTRTPPDAIAICEHNFDCHPCRNRGGDGVALADDGFEIIEGTMWFRNKMKSLNRPTSIPYRAILPQKVDGLLVPVGLSATHVAFMALRMEPVWMATSQAAATAASLAIRSGVSLRRVDMARLQRTLIEQGQPVVYFDDLELDAPDFQEVQLAALATPGDSYDVEVLRTALRGRESTCGAKTTRK